MADAEEQLLIKKIMDLLEGKSADAALFAAGYVFENVLIQTSPSAREANSRLDAIVEGVKRDIRSNMRKRLAQ